MSKDTAESAVRAEHGGGGMRFRIHFEHRDGSEDYFDVCGDTLESIRVEAGKELFKRTGSVEPVGCWAEQLSRGAEPSTERKEVKCPKTQ